MNVEGVSKDVSGFNGKYGLVSIIIVNYNTRDLLRTCLKSITTHNGGVNVEVIVVDNASRDGSIAMVELEFPAVKVIVNNLNAGFARANHDGIRVSHGDFILLQNPDTEILGDALRYSLDVFRRRPSAGIVGCRLLAPNRTLQRSTGSFPCLWKVFCEALFLDAIVNILKGRSRTDGSNEERVDYVSGAFLMIRREVIEAIGLLDDRFFMYSEEVDYCLRATMADYEVWFTPKGEVIHHWHGVSSLTARSRHWVLRSQLLFLLKHLHGPWKYLAVFLKFTGVCLRIPVYLFRGVFMLSRLEMQKALYSASALVKLLGAVPRYHPDRVSDSVKGYHA